MDGDRLIIKPQKIGQHRFGEKEIPSGFFDEPLAENVSAVMFSNAGTLSKFDRMGIVAGFGVPGIQYLRTGIRSDPDPNAAVGTRFVLDVCAPDYREYWTDEIQVFHNPNALHPLRFETMPGATHHHYESGSLKSWVPADAILSSYSIILQPGSPGGRIISGPLRTSH